MKTELQLSNKAIARLEKSKTDKFPLCVKKILSECGYDTLLSLQELNNDKLRKIEKHVNENRDIIANLECCNSQTYRAQSEFHFLPGHEAIILGIPARVAALNGNLKTVSAKKKRPTMSDEELQNKLISNFETFAAKNGRPLSKGIISKRNILEFQKATKGEETFFKCVFSCPFCAKKTPINYKLFWMSSNVTNHLKEHFTATVAINDQPVSQVVISDAVVIGG